MKRCTVVSAIVAISLLVVGCGGGGEETLSRAEFLKKVDAVCWNGHNVSFKGGQAYVVTHPSEFKKGFNPQALGKAILAATVPAMHEIAAKLEALPAPSSEEEKLDRFLVEFRKAIKTTEQKPSSKPVTSGLLYSNSNRVAREFEYGRCDGLP